MYSLCWLPLLSYIALGFSTIRMASIYKSGGKYINSKYVEVEFFANWSSYSRFFGLSTYTNFSLIFSMVSLPYDSIYFYLISGHSICLSNRSLKLLVNQKSIECHSHHWYKRFESTFWSSKTLMSGVSNAVIRFTVLVKVVPWALSGQIIGVFQFTEETLIELLKVKVRQIFSNLVGNIGLWLDPRLHLQITITEV